MSIRDICRDAHITAPTLYYYFKNKEALFDTVVRETVTMADFTKQLEDECNRVHEPDDRIRAFAKTYLSRFPKNLINTGLYLKNSTQLDAVGAETLTSGLAGIQTYLTKLIREGISKGAFGNTDQRMAADCLLGMMHRFVFENIHFKRDYDPSEAASYVSDFFIRAMKPTTRKKA